METIVSFLVDIFLFGTARVLLPLISFGKWKVDPQKSKSGYLSGWPLFSKGDDGITYVGWSGATLFAVIFWVTVILCFLY